MSTQLNPPVAELISITIATTTYPEKKKQKKQKKKKHSGISNIEEFFTLPIVSTGGVRLKRISFFGNFNGYD